MKRMVLSTTTAIVIATTTGCSPQYCSQAGTGLVNNGMINPVAAVETAGCVAVSGAQLAVVGVATAMKDNSPEQKKQRGGQVPLWGANTPPVAVEANATTDPAITSTAANADGS